MLRSWLRMRRSLSLLAAVPLDLSPVIGVASLYIFLKVILSILDRLH